MRYLIIGLGIYGSNLARDLTNIGHEVIGADVKASTVEAIKNNIATAYIVDSTDEASLSALPLKNVDVVIVTIGENFGASVKTVALLRKIGVKRLYARAIDPLHRSILEGLDVQRILTPEQRAAHDLVNEMELGGTVESLRVADDTVVCRFNAPAIYNDLHYTDLTPDRLGGLHLIAASRPNKDTNILGISHDVLKALNITDPDLTVIPGDRFTCLGSATDYHHLFDRLS